MQCAVYYYLFKSEETGGGYGRRQAFFESLLQQIFDFFDHFSPSGLGWGAPSSTKPGTTVWRGGRAGVWSRAGSIGGIN